ncbi:hypothetical protein C3K47_08065 [Solitalea longa]|uniref:Uncharacterized protein n=1 Tax=Solitalea longa TaxID=2079460 RepID=A0A2S5A375_9SPHI|nr:hypothetical protein [Solitalea longa]POY37005.1 hypothetical protein C3K47_08065 [Solitalea longa]
MVLQLPDKKQSINPDEFYLGSLANFEFGEEKMNMHKARCNLPAEFDRMLKNGLKQRGDIVQPIES